jgi:hypothetical protein
MKVISEIYATIGLPPGNGTSVFSLDLLSEWSSVSLYKWCQKTPLFAADKRLFRRTFAKVREACLGLSGSPFARPHGLLGFH